MVGTALKVWARGACLGLIVALGYSVPVGPGSADDSRLPMPALLLSDGSGMPFALSRTRGNVVVLEFWSASCPPCLNELTFLNRLQGDFPGKPLLAIAVSEDDTSMAALRTVLSRQKLTYLRPYADPGGSAAQALTLRGLPTSFVLDRHGRIVAQFEGPQQWDRPDYEKRIAFLLNEAYP
jgi:thiol-disulfide isomerase/thioredoxin